MAESLHVPHADSAFDVEGRSTDRGFERPRRAVERLVARFACLHGSRRAQESVAAWQGAPDNPGAAG